MTTDRSPEPHEQFEEASEALHASGVPMTDEQRRPRYGQPFWPTAIFGSSMYILATVAALVFLALKSPAPLQHPADPLNHEQVVPRPEWYFLFLFQILRYFGGPLEIIGTLVIPGILGAILIGLPFYDRNWSRRAVRRPIAITSAAALILALIVLTYIPIVPATTNSGTLLTAVSTTPKFSNVEAIFVKNCQTCHIAGRLGGLNLGTYQGTMAGGAISGGGVLNGAVIKAGNGKASYLWQVISWRKDLYKVGANMPLGAPNKISAIDRQNIYNWIQNGAKNG